MHRSSLSAVLPCTSGWVLIISRTCMARSLQGVEFSQHFPEATVPRHSDAWRGVAVRDELSLVITRLAPWPTGCFPPSPEGPALPSVATQMRRLEICLSAIISAWERIQISHRFAFTRMAFENDGLPKACEGCTFEPGLCRNAQTTVATIKRPILPPFGEDPRDLDRRPVRHVGCARSLWCELCQRLVMGEGILRQNRRIQPTTGRRPASMAQARDWESA